MRTGRPKKPLEIVDADREKLGLIARRPKSSQAMAMRARIVLDCGQGMSNSEVARKLHITGATVGKWRERIREVGKDGVVGEARVGTPRSHIVVCGHGCGLGRDHQHLLPATPASGVPAVSRRDRSQSSERLRCASDNGQLWHAQSCQGAWLAHAPPPLSRTLHANQW